MHALSLVFIHTILVLFVHATVFTPKCSLPEGNEKPTYVSSPQARSTLTIVWSSLGTIILCTWTILHLSIPEPQETGRHGAIWNAVRRRWLMFWRKFKWVLIALIMPEFLVGKSLGDLVSACLSSGDPKMKEHARKSGIKWTLTHAYFANMGGYVLHEGDDQFSRNPPRHCHCCPNHFDIRDEKASVAGRWNELRAWGPGGLDESLDFNLPFTVNARQLCDLLDRGLITDLPRLSQEDIEDKSKGDMLIKLWTLFQVLWLIVELIVRKVSGLSSSQLEITALSFSVCSSITYLLLLPKPKDIMIPEKIFTHRPLNEEDKEKIMQSQQLRFFGNALFSMMEPDPPKRTIPNDMYNALPALWSIDLPSFKWGLSFEDCGFMLGAIVFGAVHVLAWNFEFPSSVEQTLWRITSVSTAVIIPVYYLIELLILMIGVPKWVMQACSITTYVLYTIARLFIIVEVFRSLGYLPSDAFMATWPASIPHFG